MSRSRKAFVAGLVFLASLATTIFSGRLEGDFRIDEVHKISETFFLRLVEEGDWGSSAWLDSPVERTNPPVGKLLFGLAIQAVGQPLPTDLRVATLTQNGRRLPPPEWQAQYQRWLFPARMMSALATAATASLVLLLGWFATDLSGGLICVLFYSLNFLVAAFSATAVFDPLLSFFIVLAGALSLLIENQKIAAISASLAAALAFNVRVTGLLAIAACVVLFLITRRLRAAALSATIFPIAAIALNPFYWVPGPVSDALPQRTVSRILLQQHDLRTLL
ncbi:MAG: hypothetical protein ABIP63_09610, partial [Thermoanaerobaculia bacterium]